MGASVGTIIILLSSYLCLSLLLALIKLLHKVWLNPILIRRAMSSQGIGGPPYKFIHGSTKEMLKMREESMSRPMTNFSHEIFPRVQPHQQSWLNTYGRNFLMWLGPRAQLVITEPELIKEVLNNRERTYPKPEAEGFSKKLLGDGLVTTEGEKWARQRKLANHAFRAESLKNMFPAMIESVEIMLERWKLHEGKEIEVCEEFKVLTSDVISRTAFGSSYLQGKNIFEMLRQLCLLTSRNIFKIRIPGLSKIWKTSDEIESEKLEKGMRDSIIGIVKKREMTMTEVGNYGNDLLGLLVKAQNDADKNNRITVDDVVDECKTFYFAGHETTSTLLAWIVLLLSVHTEWQDKAREEVFKLFGKNHPNSEGIARMKTMNMIINESLRLYPPVLNVSRKTQRKVRLGNLLLPANLIVTVSTLALHGDPQIWGEDAHLFKPERFSEGVAKATNNNLAVYTPFGLGPRNCVGMNFALNEAKIALSMILQRYVLNLSPTYIHSPAQILTLQPQHGLQMNMIINESLRLYPPVLNVSRKTQRKVRLGNLLLPANLIVTVSTLALHGDPQIWGEDAHLFKPERFSEGVAKATNNNLAVYTPFGLGPRNCVGMNFALNEAKIALSMILQRYVLNLSPTYIHSPAQILTLQPQHGLQVLLHPL